MKIIVFNCKDYDQEYLDSANQTFGHELVYLETALNEQTVCLAQDAGVVCVFVNDIVDAHVIERLAGNGIKLIALRCAGFNNVDLEACAQFNVQVVHVPAYSPFAVAEHALALIQTLNRGTHRAWLRVREGNFSLQGLMGFDLNGKTVGIIGVGRIGGTFAGIMHGMGCRVIGYEPGIQNIDNVEYTSLDRLYEQSDIVSLHCPLNCDTYHLINEAALKQMKDGVMLINTSRGGVIDTDAAITALETGKIGYLGLDVYEQEADLFFQDLSDQGIHDEVFNHLMRFPNVLMTGHQAFFTHEAMVKISRTTLQNIQDIEHAGHCENQIDETRLANCNTTS